MKPTQETLNKVRKEIEEMMDRFLDKSNKDIKNLSGDEIRNFWKDEVYKIYKKHGVLEYFIDRRNKFAK